MHEFYYREHLREVRFELLSSWVQCSTLTASVKKAFSKIQASRGLFHRCSQNRAVYTTWPWTLIVRTDFWAFSRVLQAEGIKVTGKSLETRLSSCHVQSLPSYRCHLRCIVGKIIICSDIKINIGKYACLILEPIDRSCGTWAGLVTLWLMGIRGYPSLTRCFPYIWAQLMELC